MDVSQFSKIGLTQGQIKVYLALIQHGAQSKSNLAIKADISSSKVYEISEKLIKKGLISSFIKNKVTYYSASDPIFLKEYIEKKEKELQQEKRIVEELLPKLKTLKEKSEDKINFEIYEGWKGLQNATMQALEETPNQSLIYGVGVEFPESNFITKFFRKVKKKKIKMQIIFSEKPKEKIDKKIQVKYLSEISKVGIGVYPNKILFQSLDKKSPITLVLEHPKMVQSFKKIYNILWKLAKK